jgi:hypothetical protein
MRLMRATQGVYGMINYLGQRHEPRMSLHYIQDGWI